MLLAFRVLMTHTDVLYVKSKPMRIAVPSDLGKAWLGTQTNAYLVGVPSYPPVIGPIVVLLNS